MHVDATRWTGEGSFTPVLVQALETVEAIEAIRVEDAPSSRAEAGYAFIANEIYVTFRVDVRREPTRHLGVFPGTRRVAAPALTLAQLAEVLSGVETIGPPDYTDAGMLQYLKTERIVPPYQTKGVKVVEMVRIYEAASGPGP